MKRTCANCNYRVGVCPHYVECFFNDNHPSFRPSDTAKGKEVLEILKKKKVNVYDVWVLENYKQYKKNYPFASHHKEKDMLNEKEWNKLKEWIKRR